MPAPPGEIQLCLFVGRMHINVTIAIEMCIGPAMLLYANQDFRARAILYADLNVQSPAFEVTFPRVEVARYTSQAFAKWFEKLVTNCQPLHAAIKRTTYFRVSTGLGGSLAMYWEGVSRGYVSPKEVRMHEKTHGDVWQVPENEIMCLSFGAAWVKNYLMKHRKAANFNVISPLDYCCCAGVADPATWTQKMSKVPANKRTKASASQIHDLMQEFIDALGLATRPIADCLALSVLAILFNKERPECVPGLVDNVVLSEDTTMEDRHLTVCGTNRDIQVMHDIQNLYNSVDYSRYYAIHKREFCPFLMAVNPSKVLTALSSNLDEDVGNWSIFNMHWVALERYMPFNRNSLKQLLYQLPEKFAAVDEFDYADYIPALKGFFGDEVDDELIVETSKRLPPEVVHGALLELQREAEALDKAEAAL
eukprot:TRINITY_DN104658_c0_g1_i1.p1 TRINITY_DN104658_c0_g1~~TRINITY_DN104658_c0_g1_i1.p1  ORF type:complete len:422 (+),score=40.44 TRINITY_DN104658_c0_g1_i1:136-1401(+)